MDNVFDKMYYDKGELVAGIDESGVSDIAGPLVAACVILPKIDVRKDDLKIFEVDDSKVIHEVKRKHLAEAIWEKAIAIGIGETQAVEYDALGRNLGIRLAMMRAISACKRISNGEPLRPGFILVDGKLKLNCSIPYENHVDGDKKSLCVAAASIVAKVYRDNIMHELHNLYPHYKWNSNKGYPCEDHFKGIDRHGLVPGIHRIKSWPFIDNSRAKEGKVNWAKRRSRWKSITEEVLVKDCGEDLWKKVKMKLGRR
jgi:ribonuclease HII